jgi:hypothetical protein
MQPARVSLRRRVTTSSTRVGVKAQRSITMEVAVNGKGMNYLLVAGGALAVGLLIAGTSVRSLLPLALMLACPLMMVLMMRGMGGHGGGNGGVGSSRHGEAPPDRTTSPTVHVERPARWPQTG